MSAFSDIDAAREQLDWAIRLFLDQKAYIPAITLAGAAEEVAGKLKGEQSVLKQIKKSLAIETGIEEKVLVDEHLNRTKNWLKHGNDKISSPIPPLEKEAIQYIIRAIANIAGLNGALMTWESLRFLKWIKINTEIKIPEKLNDFILALQDTR